MGLTYTGLTCRAVREDGAICGGSMRDNTLDWDDALPELELARTEHHAEIPNPSPSPSHNPNPNPNPNWRTEHHAEISKLALVLGSSLRIEPALALTLTLTLTLIWVPL